MTWEEKGYFSKWQQKTGKTGRNSAQRQGRTQILFSCDTEKRMVETADSFKTSQNTLIKLIDRYISQGIEGVYFPHYGKPRIYSEDLRIRVFNLFGTSPPLGYATWKGVLPAKKLNISSDKEWKILRKGGVKIQCHRQCCISIDP